MVDSRQLEEGSDLLLDFDKLAKVARTGVPVVPVAVQDADSGQVLLVAYANQQALSHTLEHGVAAFWSTSRDELWVKGATSGDTLAIVEVRVNCEQNSLLYIVRPLGQGACHTRGADGSARKSCYYRRVEDGKLVPVDQRERTA
jgi:phosphoribosyl-AMP cyclohydrolase